MKAKEQITLVLGSGGARGLAHIGVIKYLEEKKIPIHTIVGSSIGAMVGGLYASGMGTAAMEEIVHTMDKFRMAKILMPGFTASGILDNKRVRKFIRELVGDKRVEKLPIVFRSVATDLITGEEVVIEKGALVDAIIASIAIPALFQPVYHHSRYLVDGGLSNPLPISVARGLSAQTVVAVNVAPDPARMRKLIMRKVNEKKTKQAKALPSWFTTLLMASRNTFADQPKPKSAASVKLLASSALAASSRASQDIYLPSALRVSLQTVLISANNLITLHLKQSAPDAIVAPRIEVYDMFDFHKGTEMIQCGYDAAASAGLEKICM